LAILSVLALIRTWLPLAFVSGVQGQSLLKNLEEEAGWRMGTMATVDEAKPSANENHDDNSIVEDARLYPEAGSDTLWHIILLTVLRRICCSPAVCMLVFLTFRFDHVFALLLTPKL
jgi:hypothetical protein